jgi:hypothetical protein
MLRIATSTCFKRARPALRTVALRTLSTTAPKFQSDIPPKEEKGGKDGETRDTDKRKSGSDTPCLLFPEELGWGGNGGGGGRNKNEDEGNDIKEKSSAEDGASGISVGGGELRGGVEETGGKFNRRKWISLPTEGDDSTDDF